VIRQSRPSLVGIKPSRKLKPASEKPALWWTLIARPDDDRLIDHNTCGDQATADGNDRS
jgi:hypothetical protein